MVPWNRLPHDVQRVLLALAVTAGGTASASCNLPRVCDPAPPPSVAPKPPTPTWPRVCDPPPPPPRTVTPTAGAMPGVTLTPTGTVTPTLTVTPGAQRSVTPSRSPVICDPPPPPARTTPGAMAPDSLPDAARLPLAELRTVDLAWMGGMTFGASTPWPGARYRWSASGGALTLEGERATWQPPEAPGRYLLQVAADWGRDGLAVNAIVLVVADDGGLTFG